MFGNRRDRMARTEKRDEEKGSDPKGIGPGVVPEGSKRGRKDKGKTQGAGDAAKGTEKGSGSPPGGSKGSENGNRDGDGGADGGTEEGGGDSQKAGGHGKGDRDGAGTVKSTAGFPPVDHRPAHCPNCGTGKVTTTSTRRPDPKVVQRFHKCSKCSISFQSVEQLGKIDWGEEIEEEKTDSK